MKGDDLVNQPLAWTEEATGRLRQVPTGLMRELTRQRVENLARQRGQTLVTGELMATKYYQWAEGSAQASSKMPWTEEARQRVARIPALVRGMVVKAIEAYALGQGLAEITPDIVDEAKTF